jgi:pimeloyl-ACP methyl ester carboxylesterase
VRALALVDAHLSAEGWGREMAATLSLTGEARDRKIAESFRHWLGRHSARKRTRLAQTAEALVHGTSLVTDLVASRALDERDLARITCPVLALYGEASDVLDRGRALARALPDCTLRVLPGCTHSVLWEATAEVRDTLVAWLAAH